MNAGLVADSLVMHLEKLHAKHQHVRILFLYIFQFFFTRIHRASIVTGFQVGKMRRASLIFGLRLQTQITTGVLICMCHIGSILTQRCCNFVFKYNHTLIIRAFKPINNIMNAVHAITKFLRTLNAAYLLLKTNHQYLLRDERAHYSPLFAFEYLIYFEVHWKSKSHSPTRELPVQEGSKSTQAIPFVFRDASNGILQECTS